MLRGSSSTPHVLSPGVGPVAARPQAKSILRASPTKRIPCLGALKPAHGCGAFLFCGRAPRCPIRRVHQCTRRIPPCAAGREKQARAHGEPCARIYAWPSRALMQASRLQFGTPLFRNTSQAKLLWKGSDGQLISVLGWDRIAGEGVVSESQMYNKRPDAMSHPGGWR